METLRTPDETADRDLREDVEQLDAELRELRQQERAGLAVAELRAAVATAKKKEAILLKHVDALEMRRVVLRSELAEAQRARRSAQLARVTRVTDAIGRKLGLLAMLAILGVGISIVVSVQSHSGGLDWSSKPTPDVVWSGRVVAVMTLNSVELRATSGDFRDVYVREINIERLEAGTWQSVQSLQGRALQPVKAWSIPIDFPGPGSYRAVVRLSDGEEPRAPANIVSDVIAVPRW